MYYGNNIASSQENVPGTWNSNYKLVNHLHDDFLDSTLNNNHGTNVGTTDSSGQIADAQQWDGANDLITVPSDATIDTIWSGGGTVTFWFNPSSAGEVGNGRVFQTNSNSGSNRWSVQLGGGAGGTMDILLVTVWNSNNGVWRAENNDVPANQWSYMAIIYDSDLTSNDPTFILNGVNSLALTEKRTPAGNIRADDGIKHIGNTKAFNRTYDGSMDEIRFYNGILSNEWIETEFNNQNTPGTFYTVGVEETHQCQIK